MFSNVPQCSPRRFSQCSPRRHGFFKPPRFEASIWNLDFMSLRAVPKILQGIWSFYEERPKLGAICVMEVWLQLFWIQLPQLNSFLPHPKYKSLCDWSTQNVHYVPSSLSTGVSCLPFPPLQRIKHLVFWTVPHRIERIRPNLGQMEPAEES